MLEKQVAKCMQIPRIIVTLALHNTPAMPYLCMFLFMSVTSAVSSLFYRIMMDVSSRYVKTSLVCKNDAVATAVTTDKHAVIIGIIAANALTLCKLVRPSTYVCNH